MKISEDRRSTLHSILDLVIDRINRGDATGFSLGAACQSVDVDSFLGAWSKGAGHENRYSYAGPSEEFAPFTLKGLELALLTEARSQADFTTNELKARAGRRVDKVVQMAADDLEEKIHAEALKILTRQANKPVQIL